MNTDKHLKVEKWKSERLKKLIVNGRETFLRFHVFTCVFILFILSILF